MKYVIEQFLILFVMSPLIYVGLKFMIVMERVRQEAWNTAVINAELDYQNSKGDRKE